MNDRTYNDDELNELNELEETEELEEEDETSECPAIVESDVNDSTSEETEIVLAEPAKKRGPGRPRAYLDSLERGLFLEYLDKGMGRDRICRTMSINYKKFRQTYDEDEDFRDQVNCVERARKDDMVQVVYSESLSNAEIALKALERFDRTKKLHFDMKLAKREQDLRLKVLSGGSGSTEDVGKIDLRNLSEEELLAFKTIIEKAKVKNQDSEE